ncbi:Cucumisin [Bertholletia excelsa]
MPQLWCLVFLCAFSVALALAIGVSGDANAQEREVYIVYMGALPKEGYSLSSNHLNILQGAVESSFVNQSLIRSYTKSFNAFAAYLTQQERQKLASHESVVSIFRSKTLHLHTTRSWDFMGFSENVHRNLTGESDVTLGVIDTGIWPELESFEDKGLGPPPKKWKGGCYGGSNFTCNNKIIGARNYNSLLLSDGTARDIEGHGSHTASTAAGRRVGGASFYGVGAGTARGATPSARIAVYKACHRIGGCRDVDVLAAFDDAIADGVDILTVSLGTNTPADLTDDPVAIGAFHAAQRGILTVQSAGNNGFPQGQVSSVAPWPLTVAASSIDRRIVDNVVLGNRTTLMSNAVNGFELNGTTFSLAYGNVTKDCYEDLAKKCIYECLDTELVKRKIVLCDFFRGLDEANRAGAVGSIVPADSSFPDVSLVVPLPATLLTEADFQLIQSYILSAKKPKARILKSVTVDDPSAPIVASFSSKGPNTIIPEILKPAASPSDIVYDERAVKFNFLSGTSMSCPHVAGAAIYLKSLHPDWSPSAIKSALMTTAWPMYPKNNPSGEFGYGAGHLNPLNATNPGLVYETSTNAYIKMLCDMGYDADKLRKMAGNASSCPAGPKGSPSYLNYPSMAAPVKVNSSFSVRFPREVTNVGVSNSTYKAVINQIQGPSGQNAVNISVIPNILSFKSLREKKSFTVSVSGKGLKEDEVLSASLTWVDGVHKVRSLLVLHGRST